MKRVRGNGGARSSLRKEGIVIFGQYRSPRPPPLPPSRAARLGLPPPGDRVTAPPGWSRKAIRKPGWCGLGGGRSR